MIPDPSKKSLICPKHNLELKYLHPNQSSSQKFACFQCIEEFHHVIPIKQLIESNQELIQSIESQVKSNSITMNLRETINKKIEILLNEIRKQIKINEDDTQYIKDNFLNKQKIRQFHNKSLTGQILFQKNAIQQIESLQKNPGIDQMLQAINKLNLEFLNDEVQHKQISIQEIKQPNLNQMKIKQTQDIQRYEYQLQEQSSIEHSDYCWALASNKDASIVVAGYGDDIKIFEFKNKKMKEIKLLKKKSHSNYVTCLQFLKKSNQFISGSFDNTIKIWQQDNNNKWINVETLVGHQKWVNCLVINYNEDLIISGGSDQQIIFQRLNNNKWNNDQVIKCADTVWSLSLNNTNTKLVSCDISKMIKVFEQKGNRWEITQKINVNNYGLRICFISNDDFVFLPYCSEYLYYYNFNQINQQFNMVDQLQIKNDQDDIFGFPIQFINSKNILIVKNGKFVNILRKKEWQIHFGLTN